MTTARQSQTADFATGFYYTARCTPPTNGSVPNVVIANARRAQFAASVYDDRQTVWRHLANTSDVYSMGKIE